MDLYFYIFRANSNRDSIVRHYLQPAIRAVSIRVRPLAWYAHISMRLELYGRNAGKQDLIVILESGSLKKVFIVSLFTLSVKC